MVTKAPQRSQKRRNPAQAKPVSVSDADGLVFPTLAALQRAFQISGTTAKEWKRRGMPVREDGKTYSLPAVLDWIVERRARQLVRNEGDETAQEMRKQKAALELEKEQIGVEAARLKLRRDMGDLVSREVALTKQRQQNAAIRSQLEAIPGRLARIFPNEYRDELVAELENQIYLILRRFALGETVEDDEIPS